MKVQISTGVAVFFILTALAFGMWYSYPSWDDAWVLMLVKEAGLELFPAAIPDRPLNVRLMQGAVQLGVVPMILIALALWTILGILTGQLLEILFPTLKGYKPLCIVLAVSPVLSKIHLPLYNPVPAALLPVVLSYAGLLLLYSYVTNPAKKHLFLFVGLLLFATAMSISEYAVPCALVTMVLLGSYLFIEQFKQRAFNAVIPLILITISGYSFLTYFNYRDNTTPTYFLENIKDTLARLPFKLFGAIWQSLIGTYTDSLGFVSQLSFSNRLRILSLILGIAIFLALLFACRKSRPPKLRSVILPFCALMAGILPVCLMSRPSYPGLFTRFLLPVMPLATVIFVFLLFKAFSLKYWLVPVFLIALMCGSSTVQLVAEGIAEQQTAAKYSRLLQPLVAESPHLVILVVADDETVAGAVLAAQITRNWSLESEKKFWAFKKSEADKFWENSAGCPSGDFKHTETVVLQRTATTYKVISVDKNGRIEKYCAESET